MLTKYVSYFRVSTKRQGESKLGLEAQESAIKNYLSFNKGEVIGSFKEIESGKNDNREELQKALKLCRQYNATLLIAKLDRLSRKVSFVSALMDSGVKFRAVDNPNANELTIHILASMAQHERQMISIRIKEALQKTKERGTRLGNPKNLSNTSKGRQNGTKTTKQKANRFALETYEIIEPLLSDGYSYTKIAQEFNKRGLLTARGLTGSWTAKSISNLINRVTCRK